MSKRKGQSTRRGESPAARTFAPVVSAGTAAPRAAWLTRAAFAIAIAVVIARLLMTEAIRSAIPVSPGSPPVPAGPGPSAGLLLDLLAGLCPLLVLLRRYLDPTYLLRAAWSALVFLALATWAVISTSWATDRFAAVVSSCHLLSAAGLLWAMAQVCRTRGHTRVVAGLCAGLLAVLLMHGLWYEFVERAELQKEWTTNKAQILAARNIQPGTFEYIQFENKILKGELMGFSASPNTYAALLVLLGLITLGTAAQLVATGRWTPACVMILLLLVTAGVLPKAQSRTGELTAVLGIVLLGLAVVFGRLLRRNAILFYMLGFLATVGVIAFVVGYGVSRGNLQALHDSLDFRWRYWVGSFELWKLHPLLGVGWENFGPHYLGVRIPEATEEIKDPHNYLVRFATELGAVGGALAVAWTAVTWWSITRPVVDSERDGEAAASNETGDGPATAVRSTPVRPVGRVGLIGGAAVAVVAGFGLNYLAAVDLSQDGSYLIFEVFRTVIYLAIALVMLALVCLTLDRLSSPTALAFDARRVTLIRTGLIVALGMFFIHNLIDFAMFEFGPMFLMALLVGVAIAAQGDERQAASASTSEPSPPTATGIESATSDARSPGRRAARMGLAVGGAAWVIGAVSVAIPVISSESVAAEADANFRKNVPAVAAKAYESAFENTVRNSDYAYRAATAWRWAGDPPRTKAMLDLAIEANPADAGLRAARAELMRDLKPAADQMAADDYAVAVRLDPNNVRYRIRYAEVLEKLTLPREAAGQLAKALELNDRLTKEEKKRLPEAEVAEIAVKVEKLQGRR